MNRVLLLKEIYKTPHPMGISFYDKNLVPVRDRMCSKLDRWKNQYTSL